MSPEAIPYQKHQHILSIKQLSLNTSSIMLIKAAKRTLVVLFSDSIERQSLQLHHTFLNSAKGSNEHF